MNIDIYLEMKTLWNSSKMFQCCLFSLKSSTSINNHSIKMQPYMFMYMDVNSSIVKFSIPNHNKTSIKNVYLYINFCYS